MRPVPLVGVHQRRALIIDDLVSKTLPLERRHFWFNVWPREG